MDWKKIINNEIQNRAGTVHNDGAKKIPALKALLMYVEAAEESEDDRVIKIEGNKIIFSIPEILTSIRINTPGEAFGNG